MISVENSKPGPFDENYLPVHSVKAKVEGNVENVVLDNVLLDMGKAGQFTGKGQFSTAKTEVTLKTFPFRFS